MPSDPDLILVDASTYLFRAFYGLPPLTTSAGFPTNAIRGVTAMFLKLQREYPNSTIVAVFDESDKTFRTRIYAEYKANRAPMPDDLRPQIEPIHAIVDALGINRLVVPDYEADDVIGTLATQATNGGLTTMISTSDKDLSQLVNDTCYIEDSMHNETLDRAGVEAKFGVPPERIVDYLALMGDKVDNIPGIPGVGPKTAAKWLSEYGGLDAVVAHKDEIKGKIGERLREHIEQLPLARTLATIKCDTPLDITLDELKNTGVKRDAAVALYNKYELRQFKTDLDGDTPPKVSDTTVESKTVSTIDELNQILVTAKQTGGLALSLITDGANPGGPRSFIGLGLFVTPEELGYLPLNHTGPDAANIDFSVAAMHLKGFFEDREQHVLAHDIKLIRHVLADHAIALRCAVDDVMLQSYVYKSSADQGHGLRTIAMSYLDLAVPDIRDLIGTGTKAIRRAEAPITDTATFACQTAHAVFRCHQYLSQRLAANPALDEIYKDIELRLEPVLAHMERNGTHTDVQILNDLGVELSDRISSLEAQAHELAGQQFNIGSPKQLQAILYDKLAVSPPPKAKSGNRSTAENVLLERAAEHDIIGVILNYRAATKLKSTYTDKLALEIDPRDGCIHTTYDQANARTGRLASRDPNLQNIPARTEDGRRVRQAFVAPPGHVLLTADYSQIELRIMAHMSEDAGLIDAFEQELDIHRATAAEVFDCPRSEVTHMQRQDAKAINFGLMYGMSAFGLARNLQIERRQAASYIESYFEKYPGVQNYMDTVKAKAHDDEYVETLFGRRIYLNHINARNPMLRQGAERLAINAPVQGSAADIIKSATIAVHGWLTDTERRTKMILQVHDELVFEVPEDELEDVRAGVQRCMSGAADLKVNLVVDTGTGQNWAEAH